MSRVELVAAAAAAVMGVALAGCSSGMPSMPDWMTPDWMSSKPSGPAMQPLRFESDPPGATVRTMQGQTCMTPCELTVATEIQSVSFTKEGFAPQTIQVSTGEPPDHSFFQSPPPTLVPNPVQVVMQALPPSRPPLKHKPPPHRSVSSRTRTAAKTPPAQPVSASPFPDPPATQEPQSSPFPPPPPPGAPQAQ